MRSSFRCLDEELSTHTTTLVGFCGPSIERISPKFIYSHIYITFEAEAKGTRYLAVNNHHHDVLFQVPAIGGEVPVGTIVIIERRARNQHHHISTLSK